jgi:hypothetical protein
MLPSLMHFEYGGTALTHGIGSWLRANGANGLVFPSARSDACVTVALGAIQHFHGWNFVDYRAAHAIPPMEGVIDTSQWDDFQSRGVSVDLRGPDEFNNAWTVQGIESYYAALRDLIIKGFQ